MEIQWKRVTDRNENHIIEPKREEGVTYLSFPLLEQTGEVIQGFSTRLGGVSRGAFAQMNLSFSRGDDPACVTENYRRMGQALGVAMERMVLSHQTHTTNVRRVTEEDCGKGIIKDRDYSDIDGLVTDVPGVTLVTFYADCVPLYFLDPVNHAIGLSHSGWRGTVNRMGQVTVERMRKEFGSRPEDILACIGPSICQDCYEVGEETAGQFKGAFDRRFWPLFLTEKNTATNKAGERKYQLDLWKANEIVLLEAGIAKEHMSVTDICTRCNPDLLFSHRAMGDERGNLAAFLCLK